MPDPLPWSLWFCQETLSLHASISLSLSLSLYLSLPLSLSLSPSLLISLSLLLSPSLFMSLCRNLPLCLSGGEVWRGRTEPGMLDNRKEKKTRECLVSNERSKQTITRSRSPPLHSLSPLLLLAPPHIAPHVVRPGGHWRAPPLA